MTLTAHESWALKLVQKRQRGWRWSRWVLLVIGLLCFGSGIYIQRQLVKQLHNVATAARETPEFTFILGNFIVEGSIKAQALGFMGVFLVVWAVSRWRGDPTDILLLHLLAPRDKEPQGQQAHPL